jgi:hypothetical protein
MAITTQISRSERPKPYRAAIENIIETPPQICPRNPRQMAHFTAPAAQLRHCFTDEISLCTFLREQGVASSNLAAPTRT